MSAESHVRVTLHGRFNVFEAVSVLSDQYTNGISEQRDIFEAGLFWRSSVESPYKGFEPLDTFFQFSEVSDLFLQLFAREVFWCA